MYHAAHYRMHVSVWDMRSPVYEPELLTAFPYGLEERRDARNNVSQRMCVTHGLTASDYVRKPVKYRGYKALSNASLLVNSRWTKTSAYMILRQQRIVLDEVHVHAGQTTIAHELLPCTSRQFFWLLDALLKPLHLLA